MSEPLLRATSLAAGYGGVPVVRDVNMRIEGGEVVALLGPNGAGKSTLLLALAGELPLLAGGVEFNGAPLRGPLHRRANRGLGLVTEDRAIFRGLTVRQNLALGRGDPTIATRMFPELEHLGRQPAGLISGGEQQMLTVGRALSRTPRLLLVDELSLGLAPLAVNSILEGVRRAANEGTATLLVEQHARVALSVADRAYVLHRGQIAIEGVAEELVDRLAELEDLYLSNGAMT